MFRSYFVLLFTKISGEIKISSLVLEMELSVYSFLMISFIRSIRGKKLVYQFVDKNGS